MDELPGVVWTHDGFEASVDKQDDASPHRMGCLGAVLGMVFGIAFGLGFGASAGAWLYGIVGAALLSQLFRQIAAGLRRIDHCAVGVNGTRLTWGSPLGAHAGYHSVLLEHVAGLRVRGPRPWRLLVEVENGEVQTIPVGTEANARWLAEAIGNHVRDFRTRAGEAREIPRPLQKLRE